MSQEVRVVRSVNQHRPIQLKTETPRNFFKRRESKNYRIILYQQYASLVRCDVCNSNEKTMERVTIRDELTGEVFISGMDCLKNHFNVTREELNVGSKGIKLLSRTWQDYAVGISAEYADAETTNEVIERMIAFLEKAASFSCPAIQTAIAQLHEMRENEADVASSKYDKETILPLETLIGLQSFHKNYPERFIDSGLAFQNHPLLNDNEKSVFKRFYSSPEKMDWSLLFEFHKLRRTVVNRRKLPYKIEELPPTKFGSRTDYHNGLFEYMKSRADDLGSQFGSNIPLTSVFNTIWNQLDNDKSELSKNQYQ